MKAITKRAIPLVVAAAAALAAPAAQAHEVKVVSGTTKLALSKQTGSALSTLGVTAKGTSYKVIGGVYSFHALNDGGGGTIKHSGVLTLTKGSTTVKLAKFVVDLPAADHHGARASHNGEKVLTAVVGGKRIAVGSFNTKSYKPLEEDPGFTGLKVLLNSGTAKLLNTSFATTSFKKGQLLGTLSNTSRVKEIPE